MEEFQGNTETEMSLYEQWVDMPGFSMTTETRNRLKLYRAALNGDWAVAKSIYDLYKIEIGVPLSLREDTALHVAAAANRIDFVKEIVKIMNPQDLAKQNEAGRTALFYAAVSGNMELAKEMMKGSKNIAMIPDYDETLPIVRAASLGYRKMVKYLYEQTESLLRDEDCTELLVKLIESDLYDDAMQLLEDRPQLATQRDGNEDTALHVLARKNLTTPKRRIFWRCFNLVSGAKDEENKKALKLVEHLLKSVVSDEDIKRLINIPRPLTRANAMPGKDHALYIDAAMHGNVHFLYIFIREFPDLMLACDQNGHTIIHIGVLNRQKDIFRLVYEIDSTKDIIFDYLDNEGNNILHLVAKLPTQDRLNVVSGAAFQMRRELFWFQAVYKVVPPRFAQARNKDGLTPMALFCEEHKNLKEEGEKWIKETASSCMIVATLVATVVFAAILTVPGGNKEDTGLPFYHKEVSFKIFAVSDVISLVSSTVSIAEFLSIIAPQCSQEDFFRLLPRRLIIAFAMLWLSIAAMMVVFSATTFILFKDGSLMIAILATVLASMPVILFYRQYVELFFDLLQSTFEPHYLFQKGESSIFYKAGETSKQLKKKKTWLFNDI